jgi:hypothetical protein
MPNLNCTGAYSLLDCIRNFTDYNYRVLLTGDSKFNMPKLIDSYVTFTRVLLTGDSWLIIDRALNAISQ